ncbi:Lipase 3 [Pseudocercospora fuligena]|uniref:Carboxylic ester hydrolase n=1 Tax=Pseudocercospora fuligena TaxID=685502 RepID=A0A8H6R6N3_9PEZI|nr:Lipase 3 [Pseudocercospora fuligena]
MVAVIEVAHPTIGRIKGKPQDSVVQFHGIQFATLKDRFAPAELVNPQALCHAPGPDFEQQVLLQHTLEYDRSTQYTHDLDCLNLSLAAPLSDDQDVSSDAKLPVFCFVHGGGFQSGSGSFPQYDMSKLVKLSIGAGSPIIAISINYRLNAPGFLTSQGLRAAGYESNNALRDQRTALHWIQAHISGFGGDPENVTLMGESAGAIAANYHLLSPEPLFKRLMLMSGTILLIPPIPLEAAEANYQKAMQVLGLGTATPEERIKTLLTMDGVELCSKIITSGIASVPVHDSDIVDCLTTPTFENIGTAYFEIPGRTWCQGAMIGDCQFDGNIQFLRLAHKEKGIAQNIHTSFTKSLGQETAKAVLAAYDISPETPDQEAFHQVLELCNDIHFYAPTMSLAANLSQVMPVYMYRFNEPNPWPGKFTGSAIHIQDLTWLLQNFNEFLDEKQQKQAEEFGKNMIEFVNGRHPWKPWRTSDKTARVLGPEGKVEVLKDEAPLNGRRKTIRELAESFGMDVLNEALTKFMNE